MLASNVNFCRSSYSQGLLKDYFHIIVFILVLLDLVLIDISVARQQRRLEFADSTQYNETAVLVTLVVRRPVDMFTIPTTSSRRIEEESKSTDWRHIFEADVLKDTRGRRRRRIQPVAVSHELVRRLGDVPSVAFCIVERTPRLTVKHVGRRIVNIDSSSVAMSVIMNRKTLFDTDCCFIRNTPIQLTCRFVYSGRAVTSTC